MRLLLVNPNMPRDMAAIARRTGGDIVLEMNADSPQGADAASMPGERFPILILAPVMARWYLDWVADSRPPAHCSGGRRPPDHSLGAGSLRDDLANLARWALLEETADSAPTLRIDPIRAAVTRVAA